MSTLQAPRETNAAPTTTVECWKAAGAPLRALNGFLQVSGID